MSEARYRDAIAESKDGIQGTASFRDGPTRNFYSEGRAFPEFGEATAGRRILNDQLCNHGDGVKIGMIEAFGDSTASSRVLEEHSAFSRRGFSGSPAKAQIKYMHPNFATCNENSDCDSVCAPGTWGGSAFAGGSDACLCIDGECVSHHQTQTLALVGSYHSCADAYVPEQFDSQQDYEQYLADFAPSVGLSVDDLEGCEARLIGSANADFFIANNRSTQGGTADAIDRAVARYEWLINDMEVGQVDLINESWGVQDTPTLMEYSGALSWRGVLADYYSRKYEIPIVQSAGQTPGLLTIGVPEREFGVVCDGFNTICVGGALFTDSNAGWGMSEFDFMPAAYRRDPSVNQGSGPSRRLLLSKPDLVTHARDILVPAFFTNAGASDSDGWIHNYDNASVPPVNLDVWLEQAAGTSFSAPIVTGLLGQLFRASGPRSSALLRAQLRAYQSHQPFFTNLNQNVCNPGPVPAYPIASSGSPNDCDFNAGVGAPSYFTYFSDPGQGFDGYFCGGGGAPPEPCNPEISAQGHCPAEIATSGELIANDTDEGRTALPDNAPSPNERMRGLGPVIDAGGPQDDGFAVRFAVSFYSCPAQTPNDYANVGSPAPTSRVPDEFEDPPVVDFDVGIIAWNLGSDPVLLDRTQSPDETNEVIWVSSTQGFDFYQGVLIEPQSYLPCSPTFNPDNVVGEPAAWAIKTFVAPVGPVTYP